MANKSNFITIAAFSSTIVACITIAAAIIGFNNYFTTQKQFKLVTIAQAEEIKKVKIKVHKTNIRLDQKIMSDKLYDLKRRKYMLEDRIKQTPTDNTIRKELLEIQHDIENIDKELKQLYESHIN